MREISVHINSVMQRLQLCLCSLRRYLARTGGRPGPFLASLAVCRGAPLNATQVLGTLGTDPALPNTNAPFTPTVSLLDLAISLSGSLP